MKILAMNKHGQQYTITLETLIALIEKTKLELEISKSKLEDIEPAIITDEYKTFIDDLEKI